jgi:hypothetical protein
MFLAMSRLVAIAVAAALLPAAAADAQQPSNGPTSDQIRAAIKRAEGSRSLWATVNICNTKRYRNVIGIRGQMPSLGFASALRMQFEVQYWSINSKHFRPVPGTKQWVELGAPKRGVHQGGIRFTFAPHAGTLRGIVTFEWWRAGRAIGRATRTTTRGHRNADYGDPAHFTAWKCVIR